MANVWNHCRFYAGKLSLLLLMLMDMVNDIQNGGDNHRGRLIENNGFGPISRPRDGGKKNILYAEYGVIFLTLLVSLIYQMFTGFNWSIYGFASIGFAVITSELIRRGCLFAEEIDHVEKRHSGSYFNAIKECLLPNEMTIGMLYMLSAAITIIGWKSGDASVFPLPVYIIASTCGAIFIDILNVNRLSDVEISTMNETETKNVAAGLAWSFYFGYLKIILPKFLNSIQKAQDGQYRNGHDNYRDLIDEKHRQLYIIIPADGYNRPFTDLDDRITVIGYMPPIVASRGGVKEREYKCELYRIDSADRIPEEAKHIVMTYATNLHSMYEMSEYTAANFTEEERRVQVVEYYKILKNILDDDPECAGQVKFIPIGPTSTRDFGGHAFSDIILNELRQ